MFHSVVRIRCQTTLRTRSHLERHLVQGHFQRHARLRPMTTRPPTPPLETIAFAVEPANVRYLRPTMVGMAIVACTFVMAGDIYVRQQETIWQRLERSRSRLQKTLRGMAFDEDAILADIWREKREMMLEKKRLAMERLQRRMNQFQSLPDEVKRLCLTVSLNYLAMTSAEKTMAGLVLINVAVFGCWRVARFKPFMSKWFLHHPGSGRSITLLTSCFSHQDFFHLALNMVGLWSFGSILHESLGREQFLAMYVSTGVSANVVSHILSLATRRFRPVLPSLGASGAIYGCLSGTALLYPNSSVYIAFLPFVPIRLGYALPALMGFDVMGIILRWRMFDHYAHLAGASLGLAYMHCGQEYVWQPLLKKIKDLRDTNKRGRGGGGSSGSPETVMEIRQRPRLPWRFGGNVSKE